MAESPTRGGLMAIERHDLESIDGKLQEARQKAESMAWDPNPEVVHLLARAIDETRSLIGSLDAIMAAQIEEA
jgi:hypothetical protein